MRLRSAAVHSGYDQVHCTWLATTPATQLHKLVFEFKPLMHRGCVLCAHLVLVLVADGLLCNSCYCTAHVGNMCVGPTLWVKGLAALLLL